MARAFVSNTIRTRAIDHGRPDAMDRCDIAAVYGEPLTEARATAKSGSNLAEKRLDAR